MNTSDDAFEFVVDEISELTGFDKSLVRKKVWAEALNGGVNVIGEARDYGIRPHVYDERMETLYRDGYGFIFETMVEGCRLGKQAVMRVLTERVRKHGERAASRPMKLLMLGDGCGSDTLHLVRAFPDLIDPWYFDVGGSKTFEFAQKRFQKRDMHVTVICDVGALPRSFFDVVVCLEVLEHLPNPHEGVVTIERVLKVGGIALVTESFASVLPSFPTHLRSNLKFSGRTPFLFLRHNLRMTFFNADPMLRFRPTEFTKTRGVGVKEKMALAANPYVLRWFIWGILWQMRRHFGRSL